MQKCFFFVWMCSHRKQINNSIKIYVHKGSLSSNVNETFLCVCVVSRVMMMLRTLWMNEIIIKMDKNMLPKIISCTWAKRDIRKIWETKKKINSIFICVRSSIKLYSSYNTNTHVNEKRKEQKTHRQVTFFSPLIFKNSIVRLFMTSIDACVK